MGPSLGGPRQSSQKLVAKLLSSPFLPRLREPKERDLPGPPLFVVTHRAGSSDQQTWVSQLKFRVALVRPRPLKDSAPRSWPQLSKNTTRDGWRLRTRSTTSSTL